MKLMMCRLTYAALRWICICVVLYGCLSSFTLNVAAQEPTETEAPLETPLGAPASAVAPTNTPIPTATLTPEPVFPAETPTLAYTSTLTNTLTPTATATTTPVSRVVDFRVDTQKIDTGNCVTFSWVVRGDIDRIEFDTMEDGKVPILVSAMDTRDECPVQDTEYQFTVTWLDSTKTMREVEIEVESESGEDSNGDTGGSNQGTPSPSGAVGSYASVTPIAFSDIAQQTDANGPADATAYTVPVGMLGSVRFLPETGAPQFTAATQTARPAATVKTLLAYAPGSSVRGSVADGAGNRRPALSRPEGHVALSNSRLESRLTLTVGSGLVFGISAIFCLTWMTGFVRKLF